MKKYFLIILFASVTVISCKKIYEEVPVENLTDDYIWDDKDSSANFASRYISDLYASLPTGFNRIGGDFLDAASDDAISSRPTGSAISTIALGGITLFNNPDDLWAPSYANIRKATIFLNNFHVVPFKNVIDKRSWFGEARLIRAYNYWELVKRWGGVPILGDSARGLQDEIDIPRSSFEACIEYIVSECDRAYDSLRADPVDDMNVGRWSQGGALALKSQVLLFAASPLYNGGNIGNELNGYASFDAQRWKRAADAAKAVMDMDKFILEPDFVNIFVSQRNNEVILYKAMGTGTSVETTNGPINYSSALGNGNTSPTQELVDTYGMINGKPITDPASMYDPENPYANRDPRLTHTILYNGAQWLNTSLETFNGGRSRPGGTPIQTQTGYYMRKFLGKFETANQYSAQVHDWIMIRYAEILLNYAEAMNEFSAGSPEARVAVEAIRQRAGLTPYTVDANISQDDLRQLIRDERRKELAFEAHRYWDIRRWKIAGEVYNKPLHGVSIERDPLGQFTYTEVPVLTTAFNESKMYFYPISYNEMVSNSEMVQNPGW